MALPHLLFFSILAILMFKIATELHIHFKHFNLRYWMEYLHGCPGNKTKLLILTASRRNGFEMRETIRRTWMNDSVQGEMIRFLVADPSEKETADVQQKLEAEQKQHGDLVFLHGFVDVYAHLHLKIYAALQWQQSFCAGAEWVMKADDDTVIHLRRLAHWTEKKFRQNATDHPLIFIGTAGHPNPIRDPKSEDNKWYVSWELYPREKYPPFVRGNAYLTTSATIKAIMAHTPEIVGFWIEDVMYTGILAELANATVSDQKMHFMRRAKLLNKIGTCADDERAKCGCIYTDDEVCNCMHCAYICVDGVPSLFAIFDAKNRQEIEKNYNSLINLPCLNQTVQ